jgi:transcriptional regulator with XRE-family HTH domain
MKKQPNGLYATRVLSGFSVEKVVYLMGVSIQTIYRWESGKSSPNGMQFLKLLRIYSASMDDLYLDMVRKMDRDIAARQRAFARKKAFGKRNSHSVNASC